MKIFIVKAFGYRVVLLEQNGKEVDSRDVASLTDVYHFVEKHINKLTDYPLSEVKLANPMLNAQMIIDVCSVYRSSPFHNVMPDAASKELFVLSHISNLMEVMFEERMTSGTAPQQWYFEKGSLLLS